MSQVSIAPTSHRPGRSRSAAPGPVLAVLLLAVTAGCGGGGQGAVDGVADTRGARNAGPTPTLTGGIELSPVDPAAVLVGAGLTFGSPLPSEAAALEAFVDAPEVTSAIARRAHDAGDGRRLANVLVLVLDGREIFDDGVLDAFVGATVGALGGGRARPVALAAGEGLQVVGPDATTLGFLQGDLLVVVRGAPSDAELVVTRQLEAIARGEVGSTTPVTPLVPTAPESAFVPVPTVAFASILPPEEEPPPVPPTLAGATAVQGRYGVVGGERRTVVWAFSLDAGSYPSAEAVDPAMDELVRARTRASAAPGVETADRLVFGATAPDGTTSVRAFRHRGLVLVVEGAAADQVDAVATAWIAALGPP